MRHKQFPFDKESSKEKKTSQLVLYNDDVNTFDHVIDSLIYHCGFTETQAEQCAWITHLRGKCTIKEGDYETLSKIAVLLLEEGLSVEVY